jgi:16S rRNA (cytosine1402-N4)-methyltransferase
MVGQGYGGDWRRRRLARLIGLFGAFVATSTSSHVPVLLDEVLHWLKPLPGQVMVDGTLGGGGHARAILSQIGTQGRLIGLERDPAALARAEHELAGHPVTLVDSNFCDLPEVVRQLDLDCVDGIVLDLGISSDQLADEERGFSFNSDGPLDLRFNPQQGVPAARIVNRYRQETLAEILHQFGEERHSRRIARAIVERRKREPIETSRDLANVVRRAVGARGRGEPIDPATRTFQALRIAVNDELKSLEIALRRLPDCLRPGGRLVIVSFHSLEDRRVKQAFRGDARLRVLTKRPVVPTDAEVARNPRSRSAKLRAAERL